LKCEGGNSWVNSDKEENKGDVKKSPKVEPAKEIKYPEMSKLELPKPVDIKKESPSKE